MNRNIREFALGFHSTSLDVGINYYEVQTEEWVNFMKSFYQYRYLERFGEKLPLDQIRIRPEIGKQIKATFHFSVALSEETPLKQECRNHGLSTLNEKNPSTLLKLTEVLARYQDIPTLSNQQRELIDKAGLIISDIVAPKR
jgi:hypothetical protein